MGGKKEKGLSPAELSVFCGQVAMMLEAGMPLYDGMETLAEADSKGAFADMFGAASRRVTENGSLYEALEADGRWPGYLVEMVGIGERSGQLEKVMRSLESYYAREDRMRSSIVSAVTYPLVLGVMLVVIVLVMLWRVLPIFRRVLAGMGVGLSGTGGMLMKAGSAIGWIVLAIVGIAVLAVVVIALLMRTSRREAVKQGLGNMIPAVRALTKKISASRVASVLSMMLSGGFPTQEALEMTAAVLEDPEAARKVDEVRKSMDEGNAMADALTQTNLFGELENRMIRMGAAAGREDQVLSKIADLYEEQTEESIARLVGIIEPTLVVLLSVVVGAVLLSVMLPMAGILSSL